MNKYIVIRPDEYCGMFGSIWQVIRAIYHNPNKLYYINFYDSIYNTKNENIFDYFFHQPHVKDFPPNEQIEKNVGLINNPESEFIWSSIEPNTKEEIQKRRIIFNSIIKNYLKLKSEIEEKINFFEKNNFLGNKVLGIHLRGTDHPYKKPINFYLNEIIKIENMYDKIFVCSDEEDRINNIKNTFKDKVICYDALRSQNGDVPLHMPPYESRWQRNSTYEYQYKIAEDVIIEAYLMSKTNFLFCCPGSNVNFFARCLNPYLESMEL